jgi:hypothetical protein
MIAEDPTNGPGGLSQQVSFSRTRPLGVSDHHFSGLRNYIWNSTRARTLSDYPRQPPCDLCERRAHQAILPPTASLLDAQLLNHCCAISVRRSRNPCCSPSFEPLIPGLHFNLACLHFQPPTGVPPNSILILITSGGMVLDHPLFVGSLSAGSMAAVGKSGGAGGLLDC